MGVESARVVERRGWACFALFILTIVAIFARFAFLEGTYGAAFREDAAHPLCYQTVTHVPRGRICTADGVILAEEVTLQALAIRFRYVESPGPRPKDMKLVNTGGARFREELSDMHRRLAELCGVTLDDWYDKMSQIQARVTRIAESVNRRRATDRDASAPGRIVVAEELAAHPVFLGISREAVEKITAEPDRFPGVEICGVRVRAYPHGPLAAHVVGHLGAIGQDELDEDDTLSPETRTGKLGIERRYERALRGRPGIILRTTDHKGRLICEETARPPVPGCNIRLTLHSGLQRAAETLLDDAVARRDAMYGARGGGAIVVLDIETGAILTAASAPRFNPNVFERGDSAAIRNLTASPDAPLFDRCTRMQLPPGSVFKIVAAAALLEEGVVEADTRFDCRGYLDDPGVLRCDVFTRHGVGHGTLDLHGALAQSCNVYFFHYAEALGGAALADWAGRFGLGRCTGVDLPGEASGDIGDLETLASLRLAAIGQGFVTATPLQIARMTAAIANGGRLVMPHIVDPGSLDKEAAGKLIPRAIEGLHSQTLDTLHDAMRMVVSDPKGTAYAVFHDAEVPLCAKTGTAETADGSSPRVACCLLSGGFATICDRCRARTRRERCRGGRPGGGAAGSGDGGGTFRDHSNFHE